MILDKIEVNYPRAILNYYVKFLETRKPTYIEFILIKIILDYADKNREIEEILGEELLVNDKSLFERAMKDLINFNVVHFEGEKNIEIFNYLKIKLSNLKVSEKIKKSFEQKKYLLSNLEKKIELNFVYDKLGNFAKIYKAIDWNKKNIDALNVYKIFSKDEIDFKFDLEDLKSQTLDLMNGDPETFGDKFKIDSLVLKNDLNILNIKEEIKMYLDYENIAIDVSINFDEKKYNIESENNDLKIYFKKNKRIENDFINSVFESYNKKVNEVIDDKKNSNFDNLDDGFLLQNFPSKNTEYDFLFFNFKDLKSRSKFLERPKYIENAKIIFEFNVNDDEIRIGYERKKIIIMTNKIKSLSELIKSTVIYSNYKKDLDAYSIEKIYVDSVKEKVFIAKKLNNIKNTLKKDLFETYNGIKEIFKNALKFGDYDKVALCIGILTSFEETSLVERIMYERLYSDLKYAREYSAIKKSLNKYSLKKETILMEKIIEELILKIKNDIDEEEFLNLMSKYQFSSPEIIINILNKSHFNFNISQIVNLNSLIEKNDLNVWNLNINDCLIKYMNSLFKDDTIFYNNDCKILLAIYNFISTYKVFITDLNKISTIEARKNYINLDKSLKFLNQNIDYDMQNKVDFLHAIGKLLNTPIKFYKHMILKEIEKNKDKNLYKLKRMAYEFIEETSAIINQGIMKSVVSESVEVNKKILQFSQLESGYYQAIGDDFKLNECLEIFFTYDENKDEDFIINKLREIGTN